jgi:hypothetical protein
MQKPTSPDRPVISVRAAAFGRYPSFSAASKTRARVSVEIDTSSRPLSTRQTVAPESSAARATSSRVGRFAVFGNFALSMCTRTLYHECVWIERVF